MNNKIMFFLTLLFLFAIVSCSEKSKGFNENEDRRLIRHNLYDKDGQLYFKSFKVPVGENKNDLFEEIYIEQFYSEGESDGSDRRLGAVIDGDTWERINSVFYRDKDSLFCFQPNTSGGYLLYFEDVDPDSLLFITEVGKKTIEEVKKLKSNKKIVSEVAIQESVGDENTYYFYSTDGERIYYLCDLVEGADLDTFSLIRSYAAKDKNFTYYNGQKE